MRVAFDIGGVISKYPIQFKRLYLSLEQEPSNECFVITDMHDKNKVVNILKENGFYFRKENVYCANYDKYGEMCKAVLLKELKIDIFIDDFVGYLWWDSSLGEAPIRLLVMPDPTKPYLDKSWVCEDKGFGRQKYYVKN